MYTFFSYLGVKCHIIDFHCPNGPRGQHDEPFCVVQKYFDVDNHPLSQRSTINRIYYTQKPPLYLQHQGIVLLVIEAMGINTAVYRT
ncbi:hypothetical protein BDF19DRAFT_447776 [Syncephalis fuscata]|nr:hypothetical protein BDF19DRAFT_447776 [Syncephalis fuscata]